MATDLATFCGDLRTFVDLLAASDYITPALRERASQLARQATLLWSIESLTDHPESDPPPIDDATASANAMADLAGYPTDTFLPPTDLAVRLKMAADALGPGFPMRELPEVVRQLRWIVGQLGVGGEDPAVAKQPPNGEVFVDSDPDLQKDEEHKKSYGPLLERDDWLYNLRVENPSITWKDMKERLAAKSKETGWADIDERGIQTRIMRYCGHFQRRYPEGKSGRPKTSHT